jgi:hypothetical protein
MASMLQSLRNSSDFLQKAISPETVLALANQGAKASKDAAASLSGLFKGAEKGFEGMLGISQNDQVAADEARKRNAEIEDRSRASAAMTAEGLRKQFATPVPSQQNLNLPTAQAAQPVGGIFSSMAKIGGDISGPQTGAIDLARQQLVAQQQTAQNTAKMVDKLNKLQPTSASAGGSTYQ